MKLTIIGTGYVGLVSGTCFAEVGHQVICVDNDAAKVKMLQAGGIPIYEPGLEELVKKNVASGHLKFTASTAEGVANSDVIFIAVPTPPQPDGSVDLSYIERVARDIAAAMTSYKIVVDKSTVPVKTGEKVSETIKRYCASKTEFDVVSNPEFLREGFAVGDLMHPDTAVLFGEVEGARAVAMQSPGNFLGQRLRFFQRVASLQNPAVAFIVRDLKRLIGFGFRDAGRVAGISRRWLCCPDRDGRGINGNGNRADRNGRNRFSLAG